MKSHRVNLKENILVLREKLREKLRVMLQLFGGSGVSNSLDCDSKGQKCPNRNCFVAEHCSHLQIARQKNKQEAQILFTRVMIKFGYQRLIISK